MTASVLLSEVADGIATLTLNRPDKRNALNGELVQAIKDGLGAAAEDETVRVVALRGAGKDFCSGADLAEMERITTMGLEENVEDARSLGALFQQIRDHPQPVVAAVHGRALAGGCGLASACDLVLAREDAEFGYPEVYLGFVPALVMTILRRKVGEGEAFHLVAQGDRFDAQEAHRLGLVTTIFAADAFESGVTRYLGRLAAKPASAVTMTKSLLYELDDLSFANGLDHAARVNAEARMTEACQEGIRRFLEKSSG
ncbi:MAG: enoyl-CoA hydratase/isomerase family protein [Gemmatimonadetes bacterium]|nr:enoyl-CoA hydratase/isomerase family protein [Gemmatimonadota bacterium]NNF15010.1 enoyl-CoA hydratase/isomerase family protein [Gemmatimonadota bacterium]